MSSVAAQLRAGRTAWVEGHWLEALPWPAALLTIAGCAVCEVVDPDVWWHLATGRYILSERHIPAFDVFSYTAGSHRWVTHEWLSDLLLYGAYRLVGFTGLMLFFSLLITAAFALLYRRCRSRPILAACSVLLGAAACRMTWGVRPQMFTLLLTSLYLYILDRDADAASSRVWLLPPLALLWANLHSGFVAGLAIIGVYVVSEQVRWLRRAAHQGPWLGPRARQLALVGLASAACSLITPNGVWAAVFPFGTLSNRLIQANIQEWFSPDFHAPMAWPLAIFWLTLLATLAVSRRPVALKDLLLLVGAAAAGLYSMRHVPFLALVGAPLLAQQANVLRPSQGKGSVSPMMQIALALTLSTLAVCMGVRVYTTVRDNPVAQETQYPSDAVAYLRQHGMAGRIFNTYHWGGYLIWQGYRVFIDGRAELYGDEILGEYLKAHMVEADWEKPLQRYGVETVLIETDSRLAVVLRESGRWATVYRDELATVFVPATGAHDYSTGGTSPRRNQTCAAVSVGPQAGTVRAGYRPVAAD